MAGAFAVCGATWKPKNALHCKRYVREVPVCPSSRSCSFRARVSATRTNVLRMQATAGDSKESDDEKKPRFKYDPNSDKDAFGRDPRKETEYWMEAAAEVLRSEEVVRARQEMDTEDSDGLTDEQRAYLEFAKGLSSTPKTTGTEFGAEGN